MDITGTFNFVQGGQNGHKLNNNMSMSHVPLRVPWRHWGYVPLRGT